MYMFRVKHKGTPMAYFLLLDDAHEYINNLLLTGFVKKDFCIDEIEIQEGEVRHE